MQPLCRQTFRIHVVEEARHVRFAREEIARVVPTLNPVSKAFHQLKTALVAVTVVSSFISKDVYAAAGLDTKEAVRAARVNSHHHETKRWMSEKIMGFLAEQDMVPWFTRPIYRAAHML